MPLGPRAVTPELERQIERAHELAAKISEVLGHEDPEVIGMLLGILTTGFVLSHKTRSGANEAEYREQVIESQGNLVRRMVAAQMAKQQQDDKAAH